MSKRQDSSSQGQKLGDRRLPRARGDIARKSVQYRSNGLATRPHGKPLLNLQVIQILQMMSNLIVYKTVTALRVSNHRTICCKQHYY